MYPTECRVSLVKSTDSPHDHGSPHRGHESASFMHVRTLHLHLCLSVGLTACPGNSENATESKTQGYGGSL